MRLAAIDIGTNSVHMIVVEIKPDRSFEVVDREKEMVRLGSGLDARNLPPASSSAALEALVRFRQLADSRAVDEILAVATSAVREAENGGEFLAEVEARTGIRVRVISGIQEARLIHRAAVYGVDAATGSTVVVDIGGGSMEVTLGGPNEVTLARSFPLGVIRLTESMVSTDPISEREQRRMVRHIRQKAGPFLERVRESGFDRVVATSGTSLTLAEIALSGPRGFDGDHIHHSRVPARSLHRVRKHLAGLDMQRRLKVPGLDSRRADIIVPGAILLDTVVQQLGAGEIILCDMALREGLVLDFIARNQGRIARAERYPDVRRRSVVELGERCRWYPDHSYHIARLALSLYDQAAPIHGLGDRPREWLEFAALLHDIGGHISYQGHHKHSYYLIRNGGLRGFEPEEVEAIALMARYHRGGPPRKSHPRLADLRPATRRAVRAGAAILSLVETLDRSHAQVVARVELQDRGEKFGLVLHTRGPAELERWAARRHAEAVEKLLGKPVEIENIDIAYEEHSQHAAPVPGAPVRGRGDRRVRQEHAVVAAGEVALGEREAGDRH